MIDDNKVLDDFYAKVLKKSPNYKPATHFTVDNDGVRYYKRDDGSLVGIVGPSLGKAMDKGAFQ